MAATLREGWRDGKPRCSVVAMRSRGARASFRGLQSYGNIDLELVRDFAIGYAESSI